MPLSLFICCFLSLYAAEPVFMASFDNGVDADWANGDKKPRAISEELEPFADGVAGKAVRIGAWDGMLTRGTTEIKDRKYSYLFDAKGNIDHRKGSVSFWLSPVDWDGGEEMPHRMFAFFRGADNQQCMIIYKIANRPILYFYLKNGDSVSSVHANIGHWKRHDWHFLTCNWDNGAMNLFLDGELKNIGNYTPFETPFETMKLGYLGWQFESGGSLMDDFRIYNQSLGEKEIEKLFLSREINSGTSAAMVVKVGKSTPHVDGIINDGEYATGATGFTDIRGKGFASIQSRYYLSHDDENLYFAVQSPQGTPPASNHLGRDVPVWENESVEFFINTANSDLYQFIFNSSGGFFDSKNKLTTWNSQGVRIASKISDGNWILEGAVPWTDIGATPESKLRFNFCRSFQSLAMQTSVANVGALGYAHKEKFPEAVFSPTTPAFTISSIGDLSRFDMDFTATVGSGDGTANVTIQCLHDERVVLEKKLAHPLGKEQTNFAFKHTDFPKSDKVAIALDTEKYGKLFQASYKLATAEPMKLQFLYTEIAHQQIIFNMLTTLMPESRGKLQVVFTDDGGKELLCRVFSLDAPSPNFKLTMDIAPFPPGDYTITGTRIMPDSTTALLFVEEWRKPTNPPVWDQHPFVMDEATPKPWTPLQVKGQEILCTQRVYDFGKSLFVAQLTALGKKYLAAPMAVTINGDSTIKNLKEDDIVNHGDKAHITREGIIGKVRLKTEMTMEFDGLLNVKLTYEPTTTATDIETMTLEMPFNAQYSKYCNAGKSWGSADSAPTRFFTDKPWVSDIFQDFAFWLGDEDTGFNFLAQNMRGWHCEDTARSVMISLDAAGNRKAVFQLIDRPLTLRQPRTIEFAFMLTPSRPLNAAINRCQAQEWQMWTGQYSKYFDYQDPKYAIHTPGKPNLFHYTTIVGTSPHSPDWNYWTQEWAFSTLGMVYADFPAKDLAERNRGHYIAACLNARSFLNFKTHQIQFAVDFHDIHNYYYDLGVIQPCSNALHGCKWIDDFGREQKSLPWKNAREYMRRTAQILHKRHPDGLLSVHANVQRLAPILSFADIFVGGEDFVPEVGAKGNYYDLVNSEVLRCYSLPLGLVSKNLFIPQFARALEFVNPAKKFIASEPENQRAMRHLLTLLLAHDYDVFGGSTVDSFKTEFGWNTNTIFIPYWKKHELWKIKNHRADKIVLSAFTRPEGRAVLAMVNDADTIESFSLELDCNALIGKNAPAVIKDVYIPKNQYTFANGSIKMQLGPREGRILILE